MIEDVYRRDQLKGNLNSDISFMVRPMFPLAAFNLNKMWDFHNISEKNTYPQKIKSFPFGTKKFVTQLLPFSWQQQYNTHHPYSINDGAMIPARGYQTTITAGAYVQYGPFSIQLQPEYLYAENRDYQGFYEEKSDKEWLGIYGSKYSFIDLPEKFGNTPYKKLLWGQSSFRITVGPISLGLSNENIWWGPGIRNSFIMSNTSPGFKHFTLNSIRPIRTFLGSLEGQIICGKLENSGFPPPDTTRTYQGIKLYIPKRNDWRYINGIILSYHPKWIPGLFLGASRTFISYYKDMGSDIMEYLPIISPLTKKANYGEEDSQYPTDQRASIFVRWLWQKEKAEFYWELGREDHSFNLRDYIVDIDHQRAYVVGFRKMIPLNKYKDQYIQFNIELTQLAQTKTNPERPEKLIYIHYGGIPQGYTNNGQLLGSGIGPGSNEQMLGLKWIRSFKTIGIEIERLVHNTEYLVNPVMDIRSNWVDLTTSAIAEWDYKNVLFTVKLDIMRSYNYQNLYRPVNTIPLYWNPGKDIYNYQANFGICYTFK
jgi:hypothetical protein